MICSRGVFELSPQGPFSPSHPSRRDKGGVFNPACLFSHDESGASILEGKSDITMSTVKIVENSGGFNYISYQLYVL